MDMGQRVVVLELCAARRDDGASRLRAFAVGAPKGGAVRETVPKAVAEVEGPLDRVTGKVVRQAFVVGPPCSTSNDASLPAVRFPSNPSLTVGRLLEPNQHGATFVATAKEEQPISDWLAPTWDLDVRFGTCT